MAIAQQFKYKYSVTLLNNMVNRIVRWPPTTLPHHVCAIRNT